MKRISEIQIENFRGISKKILLDLRPPNSEENPSSVIILGDNGTGKSSISDAIEYILQGRIRREDPKTIFKTLFPLGAKPDAIQNITLKFNDGTTNNLRIPREGKGKKLQTDTAFAVSPLVIRRQDVLDFWRVPSSQRIDLFFDYLSGATPWTWDFRRKQKEMQDKERKLPLLEGEIDRIERLLEKSFKTRDPTLTINFFSEKDVEHAFEPKQPTSNQKALLPAELELLNQYTRLCDQVKEIRREKVDFEDARSQGRLRRAITNANEWISSAFVTISPSKSYIKQINIDINEMDILRITLSLQNGARLDVKEYLSEANLDLLSLLIFLSLILESARAEQAKVLILDDVLQSVDATIRSKFFNWFLYEFKDWQLILLLHERFTSEIIQELSPGVFLEFEIIEWNFLTGPVIIPRRARTKDYRIVDALNSGDPVTICAEAGRFLEEICDRLTYQFEVAVPRKKRCTLADLWDPLQKKMKRTNLRPLLEEINVSKPLRNMVGAHFNDWAYAVSLQEAKDFGKSVQNLFNAIYCSSCHSWVENGSCRCEKVKIIDIG